MSLTCWDIESTIRVHLGRKANPFTEKNWCVLSAWRQHKQEAKHHYFGKQPPGPGWLKPVLEGTRILAGMNIKFDLSYALRDEENLQAWMDYIVGGGRVWDIQLAEYLLEGMGQDSQMLSLEEIAPRYGGTLKFDEIKTLWNQGVQTEDIDPDLLIKYASTGTGNELSDVDNTLKVAIGQITRATQANQINSIMLNMGALVAIVEIERNGLYVDKPLGLQIAEELRAQVAECDRTLNAFLPVDLPFEFNWSSGRHKSALVFGGKVKFERREYLLAKPHGFRAAGEYAFPDEFLSPEDMVEHIAYAQKDKVEPVLDDEGWPVFYASGKNKGEPKTRKIKVDDRDKPKSRMGEDYYTFTGFTKPKPEWANANGYCLDEDVMEVLASRNIPFLKALTSLAKLRKDLSTYFISDDGQKGLLTLVGDDGIVHHTINQTSTVTGRFSASNPNSQNFPKGKKSQVKRILKSRFDGGVIVQSDFTALEIYIQAVVTGCKQLIEDLKAGLDMHVLRLSNSPAGEGRPYDELLLLCKGNKKTGVEPDPVWDGKRTDSKVYSFQAAYGAGDNKIAETTGIGEEQVAAFRAADEARYPETVEYFDKRAEEIKSNRRPSSKFVVHPFAKGITVNLGVAKVRSPDGKVYSYTEQTSPEWLLKRGVTSGFSPTQIKNYEVQGGGAEYAKAALWIAVREFYRKRNWGGKGLLINQVHDAAYADAHPDVRLEVAAVLHASMEAASAYMEHTFGWKQPLPVPSDTTWGHSMADEEMIPGLDEPAKQAAVEIRKLYFKPDWKASYEY